MPNEATAGWHRRCWSLFRVQRGRLLTSFRQRVRRTRGEKPRVRTRIMLPRPSVPARGHHRLKEPRTGVTRRGQWRPKCPTRLPTGWHRRLLPFLGCRYSGISRCSANERRRREARNHGFRRASSSRTPVFPNGDIAGPGSNTAFNRSLEYSTDKVALCWQPPSYFSPWSPS